MIIPQRESNINGYIINPTVGLRIGVIRIMPYPPSFKRMAASTIDPAIGASTWALGNHRCRPYRGIFTMKAIM